MLKLFSRFDIPASPLCSNSTLAAAKHISSTLQQTSAQVFTGISQGHMYWWCGCPCHQHPPNPIASHVPQAQRRRE